MSILKKPIGKVIIIAAALLLIAAGVLIYIFSQNVLVDGTLYKRDSAELDLRGAELSTERYDSLKKSLPECDIRWSVPLSCGKRDSKAESVRVENLDSADLELFKYFENMTHINAMGCIEYEYLRQLREQYPDAEVIYSVPVGGENIRSDAKTVSFAGERNVDVEGLVSMAPNFSELEVIDVTGCGLASAQIDKLMAAYPEAVIKYIYTIYEKEFSTDAEEIDISLIKLTDTREIEAALKYFPRLKKVVMCDCGISNEDMDALNKKYEDIRFVWRVYFSTFNMRTDDTTFIAAKYANWDYIWDSQTDVFKYCTDLIGFDLGHMKITDLNFLQYMPHMQYLILADGPLYDITPIGEYCPELKYLEIFKCPIEDLSPLLKCKNLQDLNICYTWVRDVQPLMEMTWLDRLWFCGNFMLEDERTALQDALSDTEINMTYGGESTGGSWRYHEHYYEMRDAFGMYYMPGGTNGVDENGNAIING